MFVSVFSNDRWHTCGEKHFFIMMLQKAHAYNVFATILYLIETLIGLIAILIFELSIK